MKSRTPPIDIDALLDTADVYLQSGDPEAALAACEQVLEVSPDHLDGLRIAAEAFRDLGELEAAEDRFRRIVTLDASQAASWTGLAAVQFDDLRFEEASISVARAIRADPLLGEPYYWRGMIRERREDLHGAKRDFHRAFRLDPEGFPRPVPLDDATVEAVVEASVEGMHPSIREYLANVAIILDEIPDEDVLRSFDPPMPPGEILGFFSGNSLMDRSMGVPWNSVPATIVLFRRNLERIAWDRDQLIEELRTTVLHEVGHFLGLDEDDLAARGLD